MQGKEDGSKITKESDIYKQYEKILDDVDSYQDELMR